MANGNSADCHASGAVPYIATITRGDLDLKLCGHHLAQHVDALTEQGWDIHPLRRTTGKGVGTEATPDHFALGTAAPSAPTWAVRHITWCRDCTQREASIDGLCARCAPNGD
jgi:hypothetical protein